MNCNAGNRSYEAGVTLEQMGMKQTYNLQGRRGGLKEVRA
jgi:rhodanese-related sulfurtransferase